MNFLFFKKLSISGENLKILFSYSKMLKSTKLNQLMQNLSGYRLTTDFFPSSASFTTAYIRDVRLPSQRLTFSLEIIGNLVSSKSSF